MSGAPAKNPFDEFDGLEEATLTEAPAPSLWERVRVNFEASQATTLPGTAKELMNPVEAERAARRYESFPDRAPLFTGLTLGGMPVINPGGALEGLAALGGQIAGQVPDPINFIGGGLGRWALGRMGVTSTGAAARTFAGVIDTAAINAATDAVLQGARVAGGLQDEFSLTQFGLAAGIGGVIGAGTAKWTQRGWGEDPGKTIGETLDEAARPAPASRATDEALADEAAPADVPPAPEGPARPEAAGDAGTAVTPTPDQVAEAVAIETASVQVPAAKDVEAAVEMLRAAGQKSDALDNNAPVTARRAAAAELQAAHDNLRNLAMVSEPGGRPQTQAEWEASARRSISGQIGNLADRDLRGAGQPNGFTGEVGRTPAEIEADIAKWSQRLADPAYVKGYADALQARVAAFERGDMAAMAKPIDDLADEAPAGEVPEGRSSNARNEQEADKLDPGGAGDNGGVLGRVEGGTGAGGRAAGDGPSAPRVAASGDDAELLAKSQRGARGEPVRDAQGVASADPVSMPQLVRLHDLAGKLEEALGLPAVRQGRLSVKSGKGGGKVLGQYAPGTGVIRVRSIDDFSTLAHEAGHHLEEKIGAPLKALMKTHAAELAPLDYNPIRGNLKEGLAEYLRWAMTNPAYGAKAAPGFHAAFRQLVETSNPEIARTIDEMAAGFTAWVAQPSRAAVTSGVVSARKPGWFKRSARVLGGGWESVRGTIADVMHKGYAAFFDDISGLERGTRALARQFAKNTGRKLELNASSDPYKLARMARGAGSSAMVDLMYGVRGYRSLDVVSPSLRDALIEATGKRNALMPWDDGVVQQFNTYLWSRRAIGEWERFEQGLIPNAPDKFTKGDHAVTIAEFERDFPQFVTAATKVHEFARAVWQLKFDAGLITREQFDEGLAIKDYVPGQRHFDDDEKLGGGGGSSDGKGDVVKRFRGSTRDVINPIETLMADISQTRGMIARNEAVRALAGLAKRAGNGGGAIAERIPVREMKGTIVDPIEAAEQAARSAGLSTADTILLRDLMADMLGDEKANIFRPAIINGNGEPIVFFREGGELQALRLADGELGRDMMSAFNQMTRGESDLLINWLAKPASLIRAGITTTPEFLVANLFRDVAQSTIMYGRPFQRLQYLWTSAGDELLQRDAVRHYNAVGGIMGGANTASLRSAFVERDMQALRKRGWAAQRLTSFKGILEATELSETATRVGLMKTFKAEAEARGLSEYDAVFEGAWRARDYIDFDRRGWGMAALARIIPFWNAALQGLDKVGRHTIAPLFRESVTAEDGRDLAMAAKSWFYLGVGTIASTSLYAIQSGDWRHEEISPEVRATHWTILWGDKWLVIPKPFEFSVIFNGGEALYDSLVRNEPGQVSRFLDDLWSATAPPSVLEGNPLVSTAFELASGVDLFTGNPIVPDQVKGLEPFMQWTARTSELSKWLGAELDVSPAVADHVFTSFLGSWGSNLLSLSDWATGAKGSPGWDDMATTRRFVKDEARGSRSIGELYDQVGRTNGRMAQAAATYKELMDGNPREAAEHLARKDATTRVYVTASVSDDVEVRRTHPLFRARDAVTQINKVRREMTTGEAETSDGRTPIGAAERTAADDILADLAMVEARNALIVTGATGWAGKPLVDVTTYHRELQAVSPGAYQALADRFATARVRKFAEVAPLYGELSGRLLTEGSAAVTKDLTAGVKSAGTELDGTKIGRAEAPEVPGLGEP